MLNIQFGGQIDVNVVGHVYADSGANYDNSGVSALGVADADLGNAITWGGIVELRDANGSLVTDFTARSSDTGFDYANAFAAPVPALTTAWLFGFGLLCMIVMARMGNSTPLLLRTASPGKAPDTH
jgi:hypothetical protein